MSFTVRNQSREFEPDLYSAAEITQKLEFQNVRSKAMQPAGQREWDAPAMQCAVVQYNPLQRPRNVGSLMFCHPKFATNSNLERICSLCIQLTILSERPKR